MDDEHIQKAIYFSEHKIVDWNDTKKQAQSNINIFTKKRKELIKEAFNRNIASDSLEFEGPERYRNLLSAL